MDTTELSNTVQRLEGILFHLKRETEKQTKLLRNVEIVIAEIRSKLAEEK